MTNDIFCVGLTRTELQTLGTLLYSPDGSMCALRGEQPGQLIVRAVLRRVAPYKWLHPLRRLRVYPCSLCSGNNLLTQTISAARGAAPCTERSDTKQPGHLAVRAVCLAERTYSRQESIEVRPC